MSCCSQLQHSSVRTVFLLGEIHQIMKDILHFIASTWEYLLRHFQFRVVALVFLLAAFKNRYIAIGYIYCGGLLLGTALQNRE